MNENLEYRCDMLEVYVSSNKNAVVAKREYQVQYPNRETPSVQSFIRLYRKFRSDGSVKIKSKKEKENYKITQDVSAQILNYFQEHPRNSIRDAVRDTIQTYGSISRVLKKHKLKPFKILPVQKINEEHIRDRLEFCRRILTENELDRGFLRKVLWTDEAAFSTAGIYNRKNYHEWSNVNPYAIEEIKTSGRKTVGVWCGILNCKIIGPIFYEYNLNANRYLHWLNNEIEDLLEDLPVQSYRNMVWHQDGAPVHNTMPITQFLNNRYRTWIGRFGSIHWPANSPDLTPCDFFLWGHLKNIVYKHRCNNIEEMKERIANEIERINNDPDILKNVQENIKKRLNLCVRHHGGHFQQFC